MMPLSVGSSPVVVRFRPQFGSRSMSVCGPNRPVTISSRASVPSVWPQTLASWVSKDDARFIRVVGPVVASAFGPENVFTPCASVQQGGMMLGIVPVGAAVGPTLLHVVFVPPWNKMLALASSASVGGLSGSSCEMRFMTAGVYGASAATRGESFADGRCTGSEYGTSDGVVGLTRSLGVAALAAPGCVAAALLAVIAIAGPADAVLSNSPATRLATAAIGTVTTGKPRGCFLCGRLDRAGTRLTPSRIRKPIAEIET